MEVGSEPAAQEITSELLALFNEGRDMKTILDRIVSLLSGYLGCDAIGIRVMDRMGNIPYTAYKGYSDDFMAKEGTLCVRRQNCVCTDISKGDYDASLPLYTRYGSFFTNGLQALDIVKQGMKTGRFRGECLLVGWESMTVVPIRFCHRYYGVIHAVGRQSGLFPVARVHFIENTAAQLALFMHGQEAMAERENEFSSLLGRITHDLKNPVSSTKMFAELIETEDAGRLSPQSVDFLHRISNNADYMVKLINGLAAFGQSSAASGAERASIGLSGFVGGLIKDMGLPDITGLRMVVPPKLPTVTYPHVCLRRVLTNLISNAVKFSAQNPAPTVEIGCQEKDMFYQVSVTDNGVGIAEGELDRVFDPFYRTEDAVRIPGSGLGLSIARRIVERNGGKIWAYSDKGKGSTFYFTVPK